MNILLVSLDQAILYPPKIQKFIESKGVRCFLSTWKAEKIEKVISENRLQPSNTIIHARVAGPTVNDTFKKLEKRGYRVINNSDTLENTSNKYKSFVIANQNNIPCAETVLVKKTDLQSIMSAVNRFHIAVLKPVYSIGLGKYCKKVSKSDLVEKIQDEVKDIPGDEIIVQKYITYKKLVRVIVIGYKAIKNATTFDEPSSDWKASVCMNPDLRKYENNDSNIYILAEETAKAFGAEITFIDIFENQIGEFVLNEINTACGFIIHDDVTGAKIYEYIGEYLVNQILHK